MEKEFLTKTSRSVTLNVTGGKIDSFREQEETTGTVRVYENGCIGVAGCLGTPDEAALEKKAVKALALGIPYPCRLDGALEREEAHDEEIISVSRFIPTMQRFLDRLGEMCPRFAFQQNQPERRKGGVSQFAGTASGQLRAQHRHQSAGAEPRLGQSVRHRAFL